MKGPAGGGDKTTESARGKVREGDEDFKCFPVVLLIRLSRQQQQLGIPCPSIIWALNEWPGAQIATITCYVFAPVLTFPPIGLMTVAGEGEPRKENNVNQSIFMTRER